MATKTTDRRRLIGGADRLYGADADLARSCSGRPAKERRQDRRKRRHVTFHSLGIGKSVAIDLPADIKDVLVADPKIANAVVRSSRRVS